MRTNVDNFSLLVFLNGGREGAPRTDSLSGCSIRKAYRTRPLSIPWTDFLSRSRTSPQYLLETLSLCSHSSSPKSDSPLFCSGTDLPADDLALSLSGFSGFSGFSGTDLPGDDVALSLSASGFSATCSVSGADVSMLDASASSWFSVLVSSPNSVRSELELLRLAETNFQILLRIRHRVVKATATMLAAMKIDPISIRHSICLNIFCMEKNISGTSIFSITSSGQNASLSQVITSTKIW